MLPAEDIEQAVQDAATADTPATNDSLFQSLAGHEMYFRVTLSEDSTSGPGQPSTIPLLRLASGQHALVAYTSKDNKDLPAPYGGAKWEHLLEIVAKMPQASGMLLQNLGGATVAINKERVAQLLASLGQPLARARR